MTDKACSWAHGYSQEKDKGITNNIAVSVGWGTKWQVAKQCCMDVESAAFKTFLTHVASSKEMWDETVPVEKAFKDMGESKYQLMGLADIKTETIWESNNSKALRLAAQTNPSAC